MARYLICITGASGSIYALRLIAALTRQEADLHIVCSPWGGRVMLHETGLPLGYWLRKIRKDSAAVGMAAAATSTAAALPRIRQYRIDDFSAPVASGSFRLDGTLIVPCSLGSMGALASGVTQNLVHRAGAVALKEGWPLVLVPRETPLSLVALRSMVTLKESGACILPACPSFYAKPKTIESLADSIVHRSMDALGLAVPGALRWQDKGLI